jgi:thermitase
MSKSNNKGGSMFSSFKSKPKFSMIALALFVIIFATLAIYIVYTSMASDGETQGPELKIAGEYAPDRILVRFKPGTRGEKEREVANRNGLEQIDEIPQIEVKVLKITDKGNVAAKIRALSKNPNIIYAEPDYIVKSELTPNDPVYPSQEAYMKAISVPAGWDLSNGNKSVVIANLDTGVMSTHKDFSGRFVTGFNPYTKDSNTEDDHGHGTVTTGVSSATGNNTQFVAGMDWVSRIMPVKVLASSGSGTSSSLAQGLNWAADNGAHIANMSLGGTTASNTIENSMNYAHSKGMILFAAAGNDGTGKLNYPAAYQSVIAVGALTASSSQPNWDQKATFSSYGEQLELMAPGTRIYTTTFDGKYAYASGTSVATPFASGLAGLIKASNFNLTNEQIRTILRETATDLGDPGFDIYYGHGRINAEAAVKKAQGTGGETPPPPPPADTTAPTTSITSPTAGTTVAGAVGVDVTATDEVGVTKVELLINNKVYSSTTVSPYKFSWDTTGLTNGTYSLTSKAYDSAGNVGTSTAVSVNVNNTTATPTDDIAPTVSITNPKDGSTVSKRVSIQVSATDNVGVTKVEVYINSKLHATLTSAPYSTNWNAGHRTVPKGDNVITAIAYDAAGNAASTSVRVVK